MLSIGTFFSFQKLWLYIQYILHNRFLFISMIQLHNSHLYTYVCKFSQNFFFSAMTTVTLVLLNTNAHIYINKFNDIGIFRSNNRFSSIYKKCDVLSVISMSDVQLCKIKSDFFQLHGHTQKIGALYQKRHSYPHAFCQAWSEFAVSFTPSSQDQGHLKVKLGKKIVLEKCN